MALALLLAFGPLPASAQGILQCVTYARSLTGMTLRGNANTWWQQAAGLYDRGQTPKVGAVLAFRASSAMHCGHVAVVGKIVDSRHLLLNHANWSRPGMIERAALAEDVSAAGDWSRVRVWYAPTHSLGLRVSETYGFIYPDGAPTTVSPAAPLVQFVHYGEKAPDAALMDAGLSAAP
jgi:hypothetical protein